MEAHHLVPPSWPMKRARDVGMLAGGSFQPITGQLMQLLAAIIGHHRSPDDAGICRQEVLLPAFQGGGLPFLKKYLFSFPLHHSIFTRMEKL